MWLIRAKLQLERRIRDLALFNLAIDSKLRGCDLVALCVDDVAPNGYAVDRANVRQRKTGRPVRFELTEVTRQALDDYLRISGRKAGQCLFPGRRGTDQHLTTRQYARLVSEWVSGIGLDPLKYATPSMRRTKATLIYRRTGNLRAVQLLLGHTKIESTVRYLGVEVDDALEIAEKINTRAELTRSARQQTGEFVPITAVSNCNKMRKQTLRPSRLRGALQCRDGRASAVLYVSVINHSFGGNGSLRERACNSRWAKVSQFEKLARHLRGATRDYARKQKQQCRVGGGVLERTPCASGVVPGERLQERERAAIGGAAHLTRRRSRASR